MYEKDYEEKNNLQYLLNENFLS